MSLTLRAAKGSALTYAELDENFSYLDGRISTDVGFDTRSAMALAANSAAENSRANLNLAGHEGSFLFTGSDLSAIISLFAASVQGEQTIVVPKQSDSTGASGGYLRIDAYVRVLDTYLGVTGVDSNETDRLQALYTWAGFSGAEGIRTKTLTTTETVNISYDGTVVKKLINSKTIFNSTAGTSASNPSVAFTGTKDIHSRYPVNCHIEETVETKQAYQACLDFKFSYITGYFDLDMNDAACVGCTGVRVFGDSTGGTGSYYGYPFRVKGQAFGQTDTKLIETLPENGDMTSSRFPNNIHFLVLRASLYPIAVRDNGGNGNTYELLACEGGGSVETAFKAGHNSTDSSMVGNRYIVRYAENIDNLFVSDAAEFGTGNDFISGYVTGGENVDDAKGVLRSMQGGAGLYHKQGAAGKQPFVIDNAAVSFPPVFKDVLTPGIRLESTTDSNELDIYSSPGTSTATHAWRVGIDGTEIWRAGTSQFGDPNGLMLRDNAGTPQLSTDGGSTWQTITVT